MKPSCWRLFVLTALVAAPQAGAHPGHPAVTAADPVHFAWHAFPWVLLGVAAIAVWRRRPRSQAERVRRD